MTGWGLIDTLHAAARDENDDIIWALLDAEPGDALTVEPLELVAVMASRTAQVNLHTYFVPSERVTHVLPFSQWQLADAAGLRTNGSLALGLTARCCALIGRSELDDQLASVRAEFDDCAPEKLPAARAAAAELAVRAASALVVAHGSRSIRADSNSQRLAREAMFLLVFGTRPAIRASLLGLLAPPR